MATAIGSTYFTEVEEEHFLTHISRLKHLNHALRNKYLEKKDRLHD